MYKYQVGDIVNGYVFGDPDHPREKYTNGRIISQFENWLGDKCYVVQFNDYQYKLQEGRVEKVDDLSNKVNQSSN